MNLCMIVAGPEQKLGEVFGGVMERRRNGPALFSELAQTEAAVNSWFIYFDWQADRPFAHCGQNSAHTKAIAIKAF